MNGSGPDGTEKKENQNKKTLRDYFPIMQAVFIMTLLILIVFFVILRYQGLAAAAGTVFGALRAVFIGGFLAFLLNPIVRLIERGLLKGLKRRGREPSLGARKRIRAISVAISFLILVAFVAGLCGVIVPQVIAGVRDLVSSLEEKIALINHGLEWMTNHDAGWIKTIGDMLHGAIDAAGKWLENKLGGNAEAIGKITSSVVSAVQWVFHVIVGLVVAVYVLMRKEVFKAQTKKLVYAAFKPRWANHVMDVLREAFRIFGGFLAGDIIDAIIVGFASFVVMVILGTPYAALVALIVGVTNLIPFFGPFLGAIPGAILIVLVDPWQALYFIIMVIVIQQVDGNIIKPLVLGDSLGLSPFWIVFSILLFGKLLGVMGYFLGAPLFAMLYYIIKRIAEHFLRKRGLPVDTGQYNTFLKADPITGEAIFYDPALTSDRIRYNDSNRGFGRLHRLITSKRNETIEENEDQSEKEEEQ